ncbi:hypothetical protein PUN28_010734 [Cardiocondyla obscurior]|uniref:Transmembrane protein n=1 Tax=Cardiocondyla obscurior TaxID=286306 RepID=A0AAW2FK55_9HYME
MLVRAIARKKTERGAGEERKNKEKERERGENIDVRCTVYCAPLHSQFIVIIRIRVLVSFLRQPKRCFRKRTIWPIEYFPLIKFAQLGFILFLFYFILFARKNVFRRAFQVKLRTR